MAKLSARGRKQVAEAVREYTAKQLQARHDAIETSYKPDYVAGSDPSLTTWERVTRRLMSDGKILEKRDCLFRPGPYDPPSGRRHTYPWKVRGQLKSGLTPADFVRIYRENTKSGKPSPWTVTEGAYGVPAKVISERRLMRAVESGEQVGFCTSCGAEQGGVEPDANGYTCESCGQPSVSGAENLLAGI